MVVGDGRPHVPTRSLRPLFRILLDVWGPSPWASAQHGFRYLVGYVCECTGMRWAFGCRTHTAAIVESLTQRLRASLRLIRPDLDIEMIRTDGAGENRSRS